MIRPLQSEAALVTTGRVFKNEACLSSAGSPPQERWVRFEQTEVPTQNVFEKSASPSRKRGRAVLMVLSDKRLLMRENWWGNSLSDPPKGPMVIAVGHGGAHVTNGYVAVVQ